MKRYGIVLAAVFALVAAAVSLRAQAQDNDPDRWLKIDGWTGTYSATRQGDVCQLGSLFTANELASGSIRFNERILKRDAIIWKGTTTATVRIDRKWVLPDRCMEPTGTTVWSTVKGSGIATGTGRLTINLRTGKYHINFGLTKIEGEQKGEYWIDGILLGKGQERQTMGFHGVALNASDKLPVSGLVVSGTETEESMLPYVPYNLSWSLQPDECSLGSDIPEVVISKPGKDAELVFRNEPGEIDSKAVAYFMLEEYELPESLPRSLEWAFPEIAGSKLKTKPEDRRGKIVEFFYEGMPEKNSEFDKEREISVILAPFRECMEPVRQPVRVFFERDGMGNPSGEVPNWFYYWEQTAAAQGLKGKLLYGGECRGAEGGDVLGYFPGWSWTAYVRNPDVVAICDAATHSTWNPITKQSTEGIDTYAVTVIHEWEHKLDYDRWWRTWDEKWGGHADYWKEWGKRDADGDHIPDNQEEGVEPKMNPKKWSTHNYRMSDGHYLVWKAESRWGVGSADHEDWADPGKQSGGGE